MTRPLAVTHIASGDIWAGAEVQVYQLCKGLVESGRICTSAILFNRGILYDKLESLGVRVSLADENKYSTLEMARLAAAHLRDEKTAIVHCHGFKENIIGAIAKRLSSVPFSVKTVHGSPETRTSWRQPHKKLIAATDRLIERADLDAVVSVSDDLFALLQPRLASKLHKVNNFIDVDELRRTTPVRASAKAEAGPLKLGIVGRLVPIKRIDLFIDIVHELSTRETGDVQGLIYGDGPLLAALKAQTEALGLTEKIRFEGFHNPVYPELAKLDVLLMTSDHEGLPMVLLEALALEVPVVAHNAGGMAEVLDGGKAGYLVDRQDSKAYARAVLELTGQEALMSQYRAAGLEHLQKRFSRKENVAQYEQIYSSIAARSPAARCNG